MVKASVPYFHIKLVIKSDFFFLKNLADVLFLQLLKLISFYDCAKHSVYKIDAIFSHFRGHTNLTIKITEMQEEKSDQYVICMTIF